jgi:hypothetical protein
MLLICICTATQFGLGVGVGVGDADGLGEPMGVAVGPDAVGVAADCVGSGMSDNRAPLPG